MGTLIPLSVCWFLQVGATKHPGGFIPSEPPGQGSLEVDSKGPVMRIMGAATMHLNSRHSGDIFQINGRFQIRQMTGCERVGRVVYLKRFFQRVMISFQYKVGGVRGRGTQFDEPQYLHDSSLRILLNMSNFPWRARNNLRIATYEAVLVSHHHYRLKRDVQWRDGHRTSSLRRI